MRVSDFCDAVTVLDREVRTGAYALGALRKLPLEDWEAVLMSTPAWRSFGVIDALLGEAHDALDRNPGEAHAITTLVHRLLPGIDTPPGLEVLRQRRASVAWKEHANACFMQQRYEAAEEAARRAQAICADEPSLTLECGLAMMVLAQAVNEQKKHVEACALLDECERLLRWLDERKPLLEVMVVRAIIKCDLGDYSGDYSDARAAYLDAQAEAKRQGNARELAATTQGLGACALKSHDLPLAMTYLKSALLQFMSLGMHAEANRTIWILGLADGERGEIARAAAELESARDSFLAWGMDAFAQEINETLATIHS